MSDIRHCPVCGLLNELRAAEGPNPEGAVTFEKHDDAAGDDCPASTRVYFREDITSLVD
ncbi:MAG: hypothetical protein AB199_03905 [Parcubacteria bacterium C7867-004]|nr:MAG: hypothetical protein AB199_03905 [Parcubacteria bacterium C7867-004]